MSKKRTAAALVFFKPERLCAPQSSAHAQAGDAKTMSGNSVVVGIDVAKAHVDSGTSHGRRRVAGGRFQIRRVLYMATLAATTYNPTIKAYYQRLLAGGKLPKVALVACMRKLLTIPNAMVKTQTPWTWTNAAHGA